jgi:hypothetical protein
MKADNAAEPMFAGVEHRRRVTAHRRVVALQQLKVLMLVRGVPDGGAAQREQVGREVRRGERDPPAAVHHLLAQVQQQPPIVLHGRDAVLDPADHRHPGQLPFELAPIPRPVR